MRKSAAMLRIGALLLGSAVGCVSEGDADPRPPAGGPEPAAGKEAVMKAIREHRSGDWSPELTDEERATLFAIAADTLRWCTAERGAPFDFSRYTLTTKLKQPMATFVTLLKEGDLRGCVGSLAPADPLYLSVHENAVSAALRDTRFDPVTASEVPTLEIHVSVLSPIRPIASLDEFRIGAHGIILAKGGRRAVYLPEVAVEQGWSKEETLTSLSHKAGLPGDAWRSGARFEVFSSVVLMR